MFLPDARTGARLRRRRLQLGLSQRELATDRVSYAYISRIEAGTRNPSAWALIDLAEKLDVSALWLANGRKDGFCPYCRRH
jgi:transcriptional regulator with XRE-family HTH domain